MIRAVLAVLFCVAFGGYAFAQATCVGNQCPSGNQPYNSITDVRVSGVIQGHNIGLSPLNPVQVATIAVLPNTPTFSPPNGTLIATSNGALTINGYAVAFGDRVLVKNQAQTYQNGIYKIVATGSGSAPYQMIRDSDLFTSDQFFYGITTYDLWGGASWIMTTTGVINVNVSANVWQEYTNVFRAGSASFVTTNANLIAAKTQTYPSGVWRYGVNTVGDAPPLFFRPQTGTCAANSFVNDVGGCNDTTAGDGNSWRAEYPIRTSVLVTQFGVWADNNTADYSTKFQNAINYVEAVASVPGVSGSAEGFSGEVVVPSGGGAIICLRSGVTLHNGGMRIRGTAKQYSAIAACTGNATVVTMTNSFQELQHLTIYGANAPGITSAPLGPAVTNLPIAGGTFGATVPAILVNALGYYINDIDVSGGLWSIEVLAGDGTMQWVGAHNGYGDANVRVGDLTHQSGGFWNRMSIDQGFPGSALPAGGTTIGDWAAGTPYSANDIVRVSYAGSHYWLQATVGGTSGLASPAAPNFGATTNDNGILWGLVNRTDNGGLRVDGIPGELYVTNSDLSGPYQNNISLTNTTGGGGAGAFKCVACLPSGALETQVLIGVASGPVIINSTHTGATFQPGFFGVQIASSFTGRAVIEGNEIQGYDGAIQVDGGSGARVIVANNLISQLAAGTAVTVAQNAAAYSLFEGNTVTGSATTGFSLSSSSENVQVKNNICATGVTCDANTSSGIANLISGNTGDGPDPYIGLARICKKGINANSANTDNALPISLPQNGPNGQGASTYYRIQVIALSNASISLTTATFGIFTATGGGGTAVVAGATALSPLTAAAFNATGSLFQPTVVNGTTAVFNSTPLYLRIQTAQGSAATFDACIYYNPGGG